MELRHLRYFISVAEERNFNRAAARLHVSQPAVSRQIADLEFELGVPLFTRNGHGVELSSEGEVMLGHARNILRRCIEATDAMHAFQRNPRTERLLIGYVAAEMGGMLTSALRRFEASSPNVEFDLLDMPPGDQVKALISRELDVAFIGSPCRNLHDQVFTEVLQKQTVRAVVADHHQLALRKRLELTELSMEFFVGFCEKTFPGRNEAIINACQTAGFTPRFRYLAGGLSAALSLVAAGKGVTLVPGEVPQLAHPQTVFLKLQPAAPTLSSVAARRKDDDRVSITKLIEFCREPAGRVNVQTQARMEVVGHAGNGNASLVVRLGHRPQRPPLT
jgi:LysR family transcriptional regulator, benzoate and cis,cis-muconate-responsive activator of ben and cat genes